MRLSVVFLVVAMAMAGSGALAAGASPPAPNCDDVVNSLLPCFGFVTGSTDAPSADCCAGFVKVATSQPTCLCTLASGNTGSINATRALELPGLCKVTGVDPSTCPVASFPPTLPPAEPAPPPPPPKSPGGGVGAGQPSPSPSLPSAGGPGPQILAEAPESAAQSSIFVSRWYGVWGLATLAATAILGS